eukprot:scaffold808_cov370-Prasinococcus_capsulatus_cf.AAC.23
MPKAAEHAPCSFPENESRASFHSDVFSNDLWLACASEAGSGAGTDTLRCKCACTRGGRRWRVSCRTPVLPPGCSEALAPPRTATAGVRTSDGTDLEHLDALLANVRVAVAHAQGLLVRLDGRLVPIHAIQHHAARVERLHKHAGSERRREPPARGAGRLRAGGSHLRVPGAHLKGLVGGLQGHLEVLGGREEVLRDHGQHVHPLRALLGALPGAPGLADLDETGEVLFVEAQVVAALDRVRVCPPRPALRRVSRRARRAGWLTLADGSHAQGRTSVADEGEASDGRQVKRHHPLLQRHGVGHLAARARRQRALQDASHALAQGARAPSGGRASDPSAFGGARCP